MCNLYSMNRSQDEIRGTVGAMRDDTGNMPPLPGIFPDYVAPIVRTGADGVRELVMARWGMPGPPQFGGAPITNIRNTKSAHWRGWLASKRCVVPWTSFCEYEDRRQLTL
jgi:putative SOS response-associated peptidase YedK